MGLATIIVSPWLRKILAFDRISSLRLALRQESQELLTPVRPILLTIAIIIALIPPLAYLPQLRSQNPLTATILTGAALCLAIIVRNLARLSFNTVSNWRQSFSLTHTAFGLGCIPAAIILCFSPETVALLPEATAGSETTQPTGLSGLVLFILSVALWAAVTEEFIYRGLLLSFLRRTYWFKTQLLRDAFAIIFSGLIFGMAHLSTWGIGLSLAITGLGIGFGMAYIANGERLVPLIVYHAVFDILSLTAALLLRG